MLLETEAFGTLDIKDEEIVTFTHGILGFPEYSRYVVIEQDDTVFKFLQSAEEPNLRFVILMPELVRPDYSCALSKDQAAELRIDAADQAEVYAIVTIPDDLAGMTANLQAPIVINTQEQLGKQIVLMETGYHTRHNILAEMQRTAFAERRLSESTESSSAGTP